MDRTTAEPKKLSRRERRRLKTKASAPADDAKELTSTLLSPNDFRDLCWYVQKDYEGDVGRRAQEGVIYDTLTRLSMPNGPAPRYDKWAVMPLKETPPFPSRHVGDAMLKAAQRLRRVERRWHQLAARDQAILRFTYERTREAIPGWGETGAIVLESRLADQHYRQAKAGISKLEWLKGLRGKAGAAAELYFALQADARAILRPACTAWALTYRQGAA